MPLNVIEIVRLEAQGKYTEIYCDDGKVHTSSKNLGEFAEMLEGNQFLKIHRSHLVNTDKIKVFSKADGGTLITTDGKELPVSRAGRERLLGLF